jgi:hypothetical protein
MIVSLLSVVTKMWIWTDWPLGPPGLLRMVCRFFVDKGGISDPRIAP